MLEYLRAIGFPVSGDGDVHRMIILARERGKMLRSTRGLYILWSPGDGVELWVQLQDSGALTLTPHFRGSGLMQVGVKGMFEHPGSPMSGTVQGVARPESANEIVGAQPGGHPVFFDVPDFDLARHDIAADGEIHVQLAGFAQELRCFAEGERPPLQSGSNGQGLFIPIGLYGATGDRTTRTRALVAFSGRIEAVRLRCNPITWKPFHQLIVRTAGGSFDVVVDPQGLMGEPTVGGIASGTCWFTGRLALTSERAHRV